jgi:hypothetical protein
MTYPGVTFQRMHSRSLDDTEIVRLYVDERLRANEIACQLRCSTSLVYERLEHAGVTRTRRAPLPIEELTRLYVNDGWSSTAIGKKFNVAGSTVRSHLRTAGISVHRRPSARRLDGRRQCPNSVVFRSYALGLVWGDFAVEQRRPASRGLRIKTSTTRHEQVDLTKRVFGCFGSVSHVKRFLSVSLDASFSFLLERYGDEVPTWIRGVEPSSAFAAGYIDAEGSFGIYEGRARFKVDSYDRPVLTWIHNWCKQIGVASKLRRIAHRGDPRPGSPPFPRDLWRVNANDAFGIVRLIATLDPYMSHGQRRTDAEKARENIVKRLRSRIGNQQKPLLLSGESC